MLSRFIILLILAVVFFIADVRAILRGGNVVIAGALYESTATADGLQQLAIHPNSLDTEHVAGRRRKLSSATYNMTHFSLTCPDGYVIPDNPADSAVDFIPDTPCATACVGSKRWTENDTHLHTNIVIVLSWMGLLALLLLLATMSVDIANISYMQLTSIGFSMVPTVLNLVMSGYSDEEKFCHDNATVLTSSHGFSLCALQGVVNIYCGLGLVFSWCAQMINIFLVIIMHQHDMTRYRYYYIFFVFLLPIVTVGRVLQKGFPGYSRGMSFCFTHDASGNADIVYYFFPVMLATIVSSALFAVVIQKAMFLMDSTFKNASAGRGESVLSVGGSIHAGGPRPLRNSVFTPEDGTGTPSTIGSPAQQRIVEPETAEEIVNRFIAKLRVLSTPLRFAAVFLVCVLGTLITRIRLYSVRRKQSKIDGNYDACIFDNYYNGYTENVVGAGGDYFDAVARNDYAVAQCGVKPTYRVHLVLVMWFCIAVVGHSLLLTLVLLKRDNLRRLAYRVMGCGGVAVSASPRTTQNQHFRAQASVVSSFVEVELASPRRGNFISQQQDSGTSSVFASPMGSLKAPIGQPESGKYPSGHVIGVQFSSQKVAPAPGLAAAGPEAPSRRRSSSSAAGSAHSDTGTPMHPALEEALAQLDHVPTDEEILVIRSRLLIEENSDQEREATHPAGFAATATGVGVGVGMAAAAVTPGLGTGDKETSEETKEEEEEEEEDTVVRRPAELANAAPAIG